MPDTISLIKANPLLPAEDYTALRKQGFKNIEKLGSAIWTDYNNSDPGITILEAVCYAITDLAYRTGFEIKNLLAPEKLTDDTWKQIFYTAKQILHNSPLTINDYRKFIIDIKGVRNAWIEKSKDNEVPVWIDYNYPSKEEACSCGCHEEEICYGKLGLSAINKTTYKESFQTKFNELKNKIDNPPPNTTDEQKALWQKQLDDLQWQIDHITDTSANLIDSKIVEFEGLYNVIVEYDESVVEEEERKTIHQNIIEKLAANRNLCEDFISVNEADYEDFGIGVFATLEEYADPDVVLSQIFFTIYKYFTPSVPFYTIQQMMDKGFLVDEIFEGPGLKHGFIDNNDLEKTDLFRDIRLSDIINEIADIEGIKAITYLHLPFAGVNDVTSLKNYFDEWIDSLKQERKVARIQPSMSQVMFCKEREFITYYMGRKEDRRPERMLKLFKDLKTFESKYKLVGQQVDFAVPAGEFMNLEDYFPVTYSLPKCYGVDEQGSLSADADEKRKVQALQLKGYLLFFEQILSDYLVRLNHLKDLFSFDDAIEHTSFVKVLYTATEYNETELSEINDLKELLIDHENRGAEHWDEILKDFTAVLQNLLETPKQFNKRRNTFLNHMLARFSEDLSEYENISQWLTPYKVEERMIADKIRMLKNGEYYKISTQRGKAYDYTQYKIWDTQNVSGAERRVSRLLGFADASRRTLTTDYVVVEAMPDTSTKKNINVIKLLDPDNKETILLTSVEVKNGCCTELLITDILQYADERIYFKFFNGTKQKRWKYEETVEPFWFELYDSTDEENAVLLASSAEFQSAKDREKAFKQLQLLLDKINNNEGLHLVEHLLLRPKLDEVLNEEGTLEDVSFLSKDLCLNPCDLGIGIGEGDVPAYKKKIHRIPAEKCYDQMPWVLEYFKIPDESKSLLFQQVFADDSSEPVPLKFRKYELLTQRVRDLQEYGSQRMNYEIVSNFDQQKNAADTKFGFIIHGNKKIVLAQTEYLYATKQDAEDAILSFDADGVPTGLIPYFGFELDLYCDENPCDNNEDPYSFRATAILPCWTKRLRNPTFRNLVEKTIQTEFPAHIHVKIIWVGLQEMREFETVYYNWLEEMAQNEMPRYEVVNPLVDKLNNSKPCGECNDECD